MRIVIRTDIGGHYGMGHAVRMRALAHALDARGASVLFLTETPLLQPFVAPFPCLEMSGIAPQPDVYVVDTPRQVCALVDVPCVWIDTPSPPSDAALVIAPVAHWSVDTITRLGTQFGAHFLYGWDYVMLDDEVTRKRPFPYAKRQDRAIVFCTGGSDRDDILASMYAWSSQVLPGVGRLYCYGSDYRGTLCHGYTVSGTRPFAQQYIQKAALLVGLLGVTTYETLWFQTPQVCLARTAADIPGVLALQDALGMHIPLDYLPFWGAMTQDRFAAVVEAYWDLDVRECMHAASIGLLDGQGTARVADAILAVG